MASEAQDITAHICYRPTSGRLSHRHWFSQGEVMPTCERCGTPIDRQHKETGPISCEPEKRPEIVTLQDRRAISKAAMDALGEWLVWPDAPRDGPREVTVEQTLSFLKGLPNALGYRDISPLATPASPLPAGEGEAGIDWTEIRAAVSKAAWPAAGLVEPAMARIRAAIAVSKPTPATSQSEERATPDLRETEVQTIVAFMRDSSRHGLGDCEGEIWVIGKLADAIERGDHRALGKGDA